MEALVLACESLLPALKFRGQDMFALLPDQKHGH